MSTTSSRSSRRRTRNNANGNSTDLFSTQNANEDAISDVGSSTRSRSRSRRVAEEGSATSTNDFRSGLRTSEVELGSALSYSDMSSVHTVGNEAVSSVRPGVNDETGVRSTRVSQSARNIAGQTGTTDVSTSSGPQTVIWGTDVNIARVMSQFKQFLVTFIPSDWTSEGNRATGEAMDHARPLYVQRLEDMAITGVTALDVDCAHLRVAKPELYQQLITFPKEVIPACDAATHAFFLDRFHNVQLERPIQIRPFNCGRSRSLRSLDPDDLDQLITVNGLVIRLSGLIPEMMRAEFRCSVCGAMTSVPCEKGALAEPEACSRCHSAHTAQLLHNRCLFVDKQMVKLQENPENMPASQTPHTVLVYAHEDLVDKVHPGDRVIVTGIYRATPLRISNRQRSLKAVYKTYIDVLHFIRESDDHLQDGKNTNEPGVDVNERLLRHFTEERIQEINALGQKPDLYERLTAAIAPTIYENEDVKKGILLQLFGGTRKNFTAKGRGDFRSEVNILLCGDPGTSKSQLLQYVYRLTPRGQYTSGKGSSAVGLTAFVTKDPETRQLTLQTGALVLADNGICCIDEFDKMTDSTRSVLHEVMEQQTLSIAKAGILCQLHARTSVLAAANPVGSKWDPSKTIIDNIQLPHTLLSRFDMIFLILDPQDEVYDARLARHLVGLYYRGTRKQEDGPAARKRTTAGRASDDGVDLDKDAGLATLVVGELGVEESAVDASLLKDYIAYAKLRFHPKLSEEAGEYLVREYVEMRKLGSGRGQVSAYPRQLESLVRLAEAHARLRLSNEVTADDCREARRLQREALKQAAIDPVTGTIDINILTTGVSSSMRKRREEMAAAIWALLEERPRVLTFVYSRVLEELRARSERMVTRETFEDGLNMLKNANKIDWAGNTIRRR